MTGLLQSQSRSQSRESRANNAVIDVMSHPVGSSARGRPWPGAMLVAALLGVRVIILYVNKLGGPRSHDGWRL